MEHDPEEIWASVLSVCKAALKKAKAKPQAVKAIGITNQRETVVIWDRKTGKPIHKAIVWQDRRTADICAQLKADGLRSRSSRRRPGCCSTPISPAPRSRWLLDNVKGARDKAEKGELAFGTIDSFLIWRLTGGKVHATDATNASRTLLYNIHTGEWDDDAAAHPRRAAQPAARGEGLRGRFRRDRREAAGRRHSRSAAWRATSRRRPSARPASSPA